MHYDKNTEYIINRTIYCINYFLNVKNYDEIDCAFFIPAPGNVSQSAGTGFVKDLKLLSEVFTALQIPQMLFI